MRETIRVKNPVTEVEVTLYYTLDQWDRVSRIEFTAAGGVEFAEAWPTERGWECRAIGTADPTTLTEYLACVQAAVCRCANENALMEVRSA